MSRSNSNRNNHNKILLIVESPAKCSTIVGHLGADKYVCAATFGHLRELTRLQDMDLTFAAVPQFHVADSKSAQIAKIRALVAECKETYLMTDNDREGAGIAYHACCLFGLPIATTKRIIFNEITKPALERAIQAPQLLNMDAVHAQIARQALDMLIGFKITPALWNHLGSGSGLSAGRCQTPALRLIYDNQRDIDAAQGCIAFETAGYFTKMNLKYELSRGHDSAEACAAFLRASAAFEHVIRAPEMRAFVKAAPLPFTTCSLQQQASNELNLSPADTMLACQHLYEGGYITYPRTDSRTYSEQFLQHAATYITERWGEKYVKSNAKEDSEDVKPVNKKKCVVVKKKKTIINDVDDTEPLKPQEAHEAVRVTSLHCTEVPETMTAKEQRMYRMIWRHSAESCMAPCTGNALTSCISAPDEREYRYSIERVEFAGWRIVSQTAKADDLGVWSFFQAIAPNTTLKYNKLRSGMHVRDLKSHYSEASLISMLEERGIGRPSTFSSIVHKIQERGYVAKRDVPGQRVNCIIYELDGGVLSQFEEEREFGNEKNRLVIQPLGNTVIEFLCTHFADLFDYNYTKRMEQQLDQVSSGQKKWGDVCAECLSCVDRLLALVPPPTTKMGDNQANQAAANQSNSKITEKNLCKLLGKYNGTDLFLRTGRYGPYLTWDDQKQSLHHLKDSTNRAINENVDMIELTYDEAVRYIINGKDKCSKVSDTSNDNQKGKEGTSILREINAYTSVRSGQYGPYIYYKNAKMKTPAFISLRGFKEDWKTCDLQLLDIWSNATPVKVKK